MTIKHKLEPNYYGHPKDRDRELEMLTEVLDRYAGLGWQYAGQITMEQDGTRHYLVFRQE